MDHVLWHGLLVATGRLGFFYLRHFHHTFTICTKFKRNDINFHGL